MPVALKKMQDTRAVFVQDAALQTKFSLATKPLGNLRSIKKMTYACFAELKKCTTESIEKSFGECFYDVDEHEAGASKHRKAVSC